MYIANFDPERHSVDISKGMLAWVESDWRLADWVTRCLGCCLEVRGSRIEDVSACFLFVILTTPSAVSKCLTAVDAAR